MTNGGRMVYAFNEPQLDREAIIVFQDVSWPITTEAKAFALARQVGVLGFWRLKSRQPAKAPQ